MTCRPVETGHSSTIVDILRAVRSRPPVNTYTGVTTDGVCTGCTIFTYGGPLSAFIHVYRTELTCEGRWALAMVGADTVQAGGTVLTEVTRAIVNILLAISTRKT